MCGSSGFSGGCCPPAQIFQEKICGNFNGVLTAPVWTAPAGTYFSGTFELFNSASSLSNVTAQVTAPAAPGAVTVEPGNTTSQSVNQPTEFTIAATDIGDSGTYCITLYKRVLA